MNNVLSWWTKYITVTRLNHVIPQMSKVKNTFTVAMVTTSSRTSSRRYHFIQLSNKWPNETHLMLFRESHWEILLTDVSSTQLTLFQELSSFVMAAGGEIHAANKYWIRCGSHIRIKTWFVHELICISPISWFLIPLFNTLSSFRCMYSRPYIYWGYAIRPTYSVWPWSHQSRVKSKYTSFHTHAFYTRLPLHISLTFDKNQDKLCPTKWKRYIHINSCQRLGPSNAN